MTIKILIADDHKIIRDGLKSLINKNVNMKILGEAENGREIIKMADQFSPDVIIMDIAMPDLNGIEATRRIVAEHPSINIIALSMHSDKRFIGEMLAAGAKGYLLKDCAFDELTQAIKTVMQRKIYLCKDIAGLVIEDYISLMSSQTITPLSILSDREKEVLQLIAEGQSTKEIAHKLHLSVKTIESHRQNLMGKLDVRSVAELTKIAVREGLTSL